MDLGFERRVVDWEAGWLVLVVGFAVTMGFGSKGMLEGMGRCKGRIGGRMRMRLYRLYW